AREVLVAWVIDATTSGRAERMRSGRETGKWAKDGGFGWPAFRERVGIRGGGGGSLGVVKAGNATLSGYGTTIFEAMSTLAREHAAVNLGQGFPDDKGPEELRRAAAEYVVDGHNQYPPMMGMPGLRQAVAAHDR